jgi:hypothetical protein
VSQTYEELEAELDALLSEDRAEQQFQQLLAEAKPLGYKYSAQLSQWIVRTRAGLKYGLLSGVGKFTDGQDSWKFRGTISPYWYHRVCEELGLSSKKTQSELIEYESFKSLNKDH